jgi:predicted 2-oxoglutarate/Fe(II)-dependent dioxygenase YbiX
MDRGTILPAEVLGPEITVDQAARRALSIEIDPAILASLEEKLDAARRAISAFYGVALGMREGAALLRYGPGGYYRPHRDRAALSSWPGAAHRLVALVLFLNNSCAMPTAGDFSGGELVIFAESPSDPHDASCLTVVPRSGSLLAFPAATLHEVLPVRAGTRDVVVDWFYEAEAPPT